MAWNIFQAIDDLFRPNNNLEAISQDPISIKKLYKGDGKWITKNTILGLAVKTLYHVMTLPEMRRDKTTSALADISAKETW